MLSIESCLLRWFVDIALGLLGAGSATTHTDPWKAGSATYALILSRAR